MKLTLSKKGDPRGRHVVLVCEKDEAYVAHSVIVSEILKGQVKPVREKLNENQFAFRFNLKWLEMLSLAFPMAELSPGITRMLGRAEEKRLEGMRIPKIKIPGFTGKLYDFQKVAVKLFIDPEYAQECGYPDVIDMLNDEMGLGKTFVILSILRKLKATPSLIVVPNNAKYTWQEVAEELFGFEAVVYDTQEQSKAERAAILEKRAELTIVNVEAIRARPIHQDDNKYAPIIGYEYVNPELFDFEYEYCVIDEHHRFKNPNAQATYGFFQIKARDNLIPMSGTPFLNRPDELWPILHKKWPTEFPSFQGFVDWLAIKNPAGGDAVVAYKPEAMKELRSFLAEKSLRRRKDQVLKDLPEVITAPRVISLSREERKLYNEIRDELLLRLEDGTIKNIGGVLPQIIRLKQACFSPELYGGSKKSSKIEALKEIVEELVGSGQKAIIFSQWEKACQIIKRELSEYNPAYVTGKIKTRARQEEIRKFNEDDDCKLYIGTIDANREAINLGIATYVIFTDEGWTPAGMDQAIGRSAAGGLRAVGHKKGTKVHVIILRAHDTYEQRIEALLRRKRAVFDRTVERDAGKPVKVVTLRDIRDIL
jgi:SNF2 family DNA or RNA helicase